MKYSRLDQYPHKEIILVFLFAYASYAIGEVLGLSGIMSLFFCGIVLSHYNWYGLVLCIPPAAVVTVLLLHLSRYNLSPAAQAASEHIFKGFAMVGFKSLRSKEINPSTHPAFLMSSTEHHTSCYR